jgi:hypothetical protein
MDDNNFIFKGYGLKCVSNIDEHIEQIKKQRKIEEKEINNRLRKYCMLNDHDNIKELIRTSSKNGLFISLQLFDEIHKEDIKDNTKNKELINFLSKYCGIQWSMLTN